MYVIDQKTNAVAALLGPAKGTVGAIDPSIFAAIAAAAMHASARSFVQATASDPVPAAKGTAPAAAAAVAGSSSHANEAGASCGKTVSA